MKTKLLVCSAAALLLASCASSYYDTPYSLLGAGKENISMKTFNIGIERVDGSSPMQQPIKLTPGVHKVEVSSAFSNEVTTVSLDLKPCTQYWIVGERFDPAGNIIKVKVDLTEPIPGCKDTPAKK